MTLQTPVQTRSKLPDVGTTIFTVIGQLSAQHNAINLSQGAPNFSCDPKLVAGVTRAMEAGHNQYASMTGLPTLKERIADKIATLYGTQYDPGREVLVTASASEGLYSAISGLVHPGDEVIYFEPSFDSYAPIVRLQGATPVAIKLTVPDFAVNWDEVRAAITPRTHIIIINTPHNPSGQVFSASDLQQLAALRGAVNGLMAEILDSHLRGEFTQLASDPRTRKQHQQSIDEVIALVRSYLK